MGPLKNSIRTILTNGLATRFCVSSRVARKFLPEDIEQWGKLRRLEGGDIMHTHDVASKYMSGRDASFIRVRELVFWKMIDFNLCPIV